jgi:hypothetical protein
VLYLVYIIFELSPLKWEKKIIFYSLTFGVMYGWNCICRYFIEYSGQVLSNFFFYRVIPLELRKNKTFSNFCRDVCTCIRPKFHMGVFTRKYKSSSNLVLVRWFLTVITLELWKAFGILAACDYDTLVFLCCWFVVDLNCTIHGTEIFIYDSTWNIKLELKSRTAQK